MAATTAASVFTAPIFTSGAATSRVATTTATALAWRAKRIRFFLLADTVARGQGDFELVKLVPLFLGTLVVGDRQQRLQAATRGGGVLFSHGRHYPISEAGRT
jgi:hypothetical protein